MSKQKRPIDRIAPDDLPEQVDADVETVDGAVEHLHKFGQTTTPDDELPKCNVCLSQRVRRRPTDPEQNSSCEHDEEWLCTSCDHRFDDPVYSDPEAAFRWVGQDVGARLVDPPIERRLEQLDDDALAALAIVLYSPWHHTDDDPSHRDLAKVFPYSRNWIGKQIRAWRDGEFRELVPDPRPWRVDE
jgi:hypothetical protein